jgi:hypothetical protein
MKKLIYISLLIFMFAVACTPAVKITERDEKDLRSVPSELSGLDWKRTPMSVLSNPIMEEPLMWLGLVKNVSVTEEDNKTKIEWFCEHLSFVETGPAAISGRPIKARKGEGDFAISLIMTDMTKEQALKFKSEQTSTAHYILVAGKFDGFVEREGRRIPFLYSLRFDLGRNLAVMTEPN